jgi:putative oxidoreductase
MNTTIMFDILVLLVRVYLGYVFIPSGWAKILGGQEKWMWLGQQMGNLGIHFAPILWGLAATAAEFFGGIALLIGFGTRVAAFFLAFTMFVAVIFHIKNNDPWTIYWFPLSLMIGLICLMIYGGGQYSIDHWLWQ